MIDNPGFEALAPALPDPSG